MQVVFNIVFVESEGILIMKLIEFSKTECGVDFLRKSGPKKN